MNGNVRTEALLASEANASGIYWGAVIAGAFVTAALWLTLTFLGVGLGLSAISPWTHASASPKSLNVGAIIWLIVSQIIASSLGGYLAGRWRIRWSIVHTNEVFFRDTAHGFLVWAVAVVASAAFLGTALSAILGSEVKYAAMTTAVGSEPGRPYATMPGGTTTAPGDKSPTVPGESESNKPGGGVTPGESGGMSPTTPGGDTTKQGGGYETAPGVAGQPYSRITPLPGASATPSPQEMEQARKAAAKTSIWMFIALLIGAFCASLAATIGGRQRDSVVYYEVETRRDSGLITPESK